MCGIVAYIGEREAFPILIEGLKRLEYRGYDSAGVALVNGGIQTIKKKGKVSELEKEAKNYTISSKLGIVAMVCNGTICTTTRVLCSLSKATHSTPLLILSGAKTR